MKWHYFVPTVVRGTLQNQAIKLILPNTGDKHLLPYKEITLELPAEGTKETNKQTRQNNINQMQIASRWTKAEDTPDMQLNITQNNTVREGGAKAKRNTAAAG